MRALVALLLIAAPAQAATVTVTITGVRTAHGHVLVAICPRANFLQPDCPWHGLAQAHPGDVRVVIDNVPPGTYAAQAFHDEDDNGRLERSFLGLPKEGMGFSNDAPMHFGPPRFDTASFKLGGGGGGMAIRFKLKYYE
jgi:uncharacterized protein (DUF2141 family)